MKGKALEKFEEWYFKKYGLGFHQLPLVCQQALWVEWFDAQGIIIYTYCINDNMKPIWNYSFKDIFESRFEFYSRPEALSKAIEKATEVFNNKSK